MPELIEVLLDDETKRVLDRLRIAPQERHCLIMILAERLAALDLDLANPKRVLQALKARAAVPFSAAPRADAMARVTARIPHPQFMGAPDHYLGDLLVELQLRKIRKDVSRER